MRRPPESGVDTLMPEGSAERRRGRRVILQAPLLVRRIGASGPEPFEKAQVTQNLGLAGVYFEMDDEQMLTVNEFVITSVAIPEPRRREFPFTRLVGQGRVVRIQELPQQEPGGGKRFGVALEFGDDMTALSALPTRA